MKNSLEHWVAPAFRERRFSGRFPRLRRIIGNELHLVELQFTKWGGGFRLNLAVFPAEGITTKWGQKVGPEQLAFGYPMNRYYLLNPRNVREGRSRDYWFRFDEKNTDQVAKDFLPHVEVADRWFLTGEAPTFPPERLLDRLVRRMFPRYT